MPWIPSRGADRSQLRFPRRPWLQRPRLGLDRPPGSWPARLATAVLAMASASVGLGDVGPVGFQMVLEEGDYTAMELPVDGVRDISVVPYGVFGESLAIIVPQTSIPWRSAQLVALSDATSGADAADDESVAVVVLLLSPQVVPFLVYPTGAQQWSPTRGWPSLTSMLEIIGVNLAASVGVEDVDIDGATGGPPPTEDAVGPLKRNHWPSTLYSFAALMEAEELAAGMS